MSVFPSQCSRWGPRPTPLSNLQRNPDSACIERARMKCFTGKRNKRCQQTPSPCSGRATLSKLAKLGTELLEHTLVGRKECRLRFLGETPVGWQLGLVALTQGLLARLRWNCRDRGQACKLKDRVWRRKTGGSLLLSQPFSFFKHQ